MAILVVLGLEEGITQRHRLNALHIRIHDKLRVNVKEHGHIDRLSCIQPLLLEAETLYLAEIRRDLARRDGVCGDTDDVFGRLVCGGVKGEGSFAGEHADLALLGDELPRKYIGDGAVEGYA
jgi:hypothetical protein